MRPKGSAKELEVRRRMAAKRARQRLSLPQMPEVRVKLEVPGGRFSSPGKVGPKYGMPGGGMERTATGKIPVRILEVYE
jgi:hypothetical protein